ncbi:hypothetical protein AB0B94_30725 [Micromonospora sp. NPDC048986]|uniref:hypothetical protein n=1 Tax=Micromonospora sp. NPDC048986 TaxID=3155644 RepID=UPI0033FC9988
MSLPIPLTIRLVTSRGDRHITADARDLVMRWTDPGGYASCRVPLDRPLSIQPDEIAYYGTVTVYDARTGMVMWDGRMEDPGRSAGADGQVWELTAVGGQAHTRDRTVPIGYADRDMGSLLRQDNATPGASASVGTDPGDSAGLRQALVLQFPSGTPMVSGTRVVMRYWRFALAGQKPARISYTWDAGRTNTDYVIQTVARTDGVLGVGEIATSATLSTSGGSASAVVGTDWFNGRNTIEWRVQYSGGAATEGADTAWVAVSSIVLIAMRYNASGVEVTSGYTTDYVLAHQVVNDLLGRLLNQFDGPSAVVATTSHQIQQLTYPDGTDPGQVLADLMALEPNFTWRVWERGPNGKYRFEWTLIPTAVQYEADLTDGYDAPGSADGLYNRVTVRWRDATGRTQITTRSATVPVLDAAGLIRQGQIDLGAEVGSLADAQRAGDAWLADRSQPANAGRLRIARPIQDLISGRMVQPWEIRPGLIRVRGILPRVDALNATSRDGVTVFRIVASEFRASDASATLELDSYAASTARALADLRRQAQSTRR